MDHDPGSSASVCRMGEFVMLASYWVGMVPVGAVCLVRGVGGEGRAFTEERDSVASFSSHVSQLPVHHWRRPHASRPSSICLRS